MASRQSLHGSEKAIESARLSRTSVFQPIIVDASHNLASMKESDGTEGNPIASQARLSIVSDELNKEESSPRTVPSEDKPRRDSDKRRTSATGPAGSGLPPAETAFTSEKEVVEDKEDGKAHQADRIRSTLLELPQINVGESISARPIQSPMALSTKQMASLNANSVVVDRHDIAAVTPLVRTHSKDSTSSHGSKGSEHTSTRHDAKVIFQAAQTARSKRPSLVKNPASGRAGIQLADLASFIRTGESSPSRQSLPSRAGGLNRARTVAARPSSKEWAQIIQDTEDQQFSSKGLSVDRSTIVLGPLNTAIDADKPTTQHKMKSMSLQDALRLNPIDTNALPRRSTTLPAPRGISKNTTFLPLPLADHSGTDFRRKRPVTTPYPKARDELKHIEHNIDKEDDTASPDWAFRLHEISLCVSARNRISTISIPQFDTESSKSKDKTGVWWSSTECDDERLVRLAQKEYTRIQGKARSVLGAKTAKAVSINFVRAHIASHIVEPDTLLLDGRFNLDAQSDFSSLWANPKQGTSKRDWLNVLANHVKMYGVARTFVFNVHEGYDAVRVVTAFAVITSISLIGMLLWLFLGTGSETALVLVRESTAVPRDQQMLRTSGRVGDAFLFGVWTLLIGWTAIGGWMIAS